MTPADLVPQVAAAFDIAEVELTGWSRVPRLARARFALCWLARQIDGCSYRAIGAVISGRDHTSIIHAVKRAEQLRDTDANYRARTDRLREAIIGARRG